MMLEPSGPTSHSFISQRLRLPVCLCMLWVAMAGAAGGAPPADARRPALPLEGVVTNPDWLQKPTAEDLTRFYPPLPQFMGLSGHVLLTCTVDRDGAVSNCRTAAELPAGLGFGEAGILASAMFRMKPQTLDGVPVEGARVNIPFTFMVPLPASAPQLAEVGPEPPAATLVLARRVAALTIDESQARAVIEAQMKQMRASMSGAFTHEQELAIEALEQAEVASLDRRIERTARYFATKISSADLARIANFVGSPAGKAWYITMGEAQTRDMANVQPLWFATVADARAKLCRQLTCFGKDASPTTDKPAAIATPRKP